MEFDVAAHGTDRVAKIFESSRRSRVEASVALRVRALKFADHFAATVYRRRQATSHASVCPFPNGAARRKLGAGPKRILSVSLSAASLAMSGGPTNRSNYPILPNFIFQATGQGQAPLIADRKLTGDAPVPDFVDSLINDVKAPPAAVARSTDVPIAKRTVARQQNFSLNGLGPPGRCFLNSSRGWVEKGVKPRLDDRIALARRFLQSWAV